MGIFLSKNFRDQSVLYLKDLIGDIIPKTHVSLIFRSKFQVSALTPKVRGTIALAMAAPCWPLAGFLP